MKRFSKILSVALALCMLLAIGVMASGEASGGMSMPGGGGQSAPDSYDSVMDITEDQDLVGVEMASENGDENVIHVYDGAVVSIADSSFENHGEGGGGDASSFYGVGATLFVSDGELYVSDTDIATDCSGGAGVFAYDNGVAYVSGATISTTQASAGGLHVAGGGTLYAWDCDVHTEASMAAAPIRSDRGGGLMVIDGGSYVAEGGTGAVYVTADITVHDAYLYAGASEAIAIEGKNTIRLFDCDLTGNMVSGDLNDGNVWNIIVYQSMSGDADVGTSEYDMIGGTLTTNAGPVVYNTNTSSYITFKGVDINYGDTTTWFLQVTGNNSSRTWGTAGKNGANCIFSAYEQAMEGGVVYDTISNLDFYMIDGSSLEGAIVLDDSYNGGNSGDGICNVYITEDSTWTVTGDSEINGTLYCAGTIENAQVVDAAGNTYGEGEYTVTVGAYETTVDTSAAGEVPVWEDYAVENPFAGASDEASGEASAEAAGGDTSEAAYQAYLKSYVDACPAVSDEQYEEFAALIDAGNYTDFPVEMCFTDAYWGFVAATYDEFVAAGGNVELPDFDPSLTQDAEA